MIPVSTPVLDGNERRYLEECIESGWISSEGPFVRRIERDLATYTGRKHGLAVANGTAALDVAVTALGIGPGDEVILPTFTIISCAAAVVRAGATPVLVDLHPDTWNMNTAQIAARITPRTKAIMVVHLYGLPCDMDPVMELSRRHGIPIIEDCAELLGQRYRDKRCGSFGTIATYSFYANKHVASGEGGMICCDDDELAKRCDSLRNLGLQRGADRFKHEVLGWNFRMSNIQAAVAVAQMERLDSTITKKRAIGLRYRELLAEVPHLALPTDSTPYADSIYWVVGLELTESAPFDAAEAMHRLAAEGVDTRPFFWPMHEQPVFRARGLFLGERHSVSERLARRGFYIPSGIGLTDEQLKTVADAVRMVLTK